MPDIGVPTLPHALPKFEPQHHVKVLAAVLEEALVWSYPMYLNESDIHSGEVVHLQELGCSIGKNACRSLEGSGTGQLWT